jgi:protocatechuate 3,4-dioxygenase beta subunit
MFTPEGTLGPFYPGMFALKSMPSDLSVIAPILAHRPEGVPIHLSGRFTDFNGAPVPSLIVEIWQANAHGRYRHPADHSDRPLDPQFDGFARIRTNDDGFYEFHTIKPGPHPIREGSNIVRAPHLRFTIFASGIDRIVTQVFFEDEPLNESDPVLRCIPDLAIRGRLIASRRGEGQYRLDIVMRGENETPFFDDWVR